MEKDVPKLGYIYHLPNLNHPEDPFTMEVFLLSEPTGTYFDVVKAQFEVVSELGDNEHLTIRHPWNFQKTARVCSGFVILDDRTGKREEAFSFGGQVKIESDESMTSVKLVSSAPILNITNADPQHAFFIEELEIVLAKQRAKRQDEEEFNKTLCSVEPFRLYLASLMELIHKFEGLANTSERNLQMVKFLHHEHHRLMAAGLIKAPVLTLEDIFGAA